MKKSITALNLNLKDTFEYAGLSFTVVSLSLEDTDVRVKCDNGQVFVFGASHHLVLVCPF